MISGPISPIISPSRNNSSVSPDLLALFLISFVTVITYLGLGSHSFIDYDDFRIIVNRINTYDGLTLDNLATIIFRDSPREEPLIIRDISYLINAEVFGPLNPQGYLAGNLLLHILNSFLTYRLFLALFPAKYWPATLTAILFAVHPIHVESVAWVSSRKDTLYACFFLFSFSLYRSFLATSKTWSLLGSYLLFVCALFSKSAAIAFWPLIVSYRLLLCPSKRWKTQEQFYLGTTALSTILFVIWYHWELTTYGVFTRQGESLLTHAPGQWFLLNTEAITFYLLKLFWPMDLSITYNEPTPLSLFNDLPFLILSLFFIAIAVLLAIVLWRGQNKRLLFLLCWFILTLVPYLNLAGVNIYVADRYCYLASFAVFAVTAIGLSALCNRCLTTQESSYRHLNYAATVTAILLCTVLSLISIKTIKVWESTETLWTNALRVAPLRFDSYAGLTGALLASYEATRNENKGHSSLVKAKKVATACYSRFCSDDQCPPFMARILIMLGKINYYEKDLASAERYLKEVLIRDAYNLSALHVYSYVLIGQGRYREAERMIMDIEHSADPEKNKKMLSDIRNQLRPLLSAKQRTTHTPLPKQAM